MKNLYTRGLMLSPVLMILFMIDLHAQSFVYTDNDPFGPNSVTAFSIAGNGALTNIGTFATGGTGAGGGFFASNRARTCTVGNRLYVANDGNSSVTGFDINPFTGSLSLVPGSPFATGGAAGLGISLDCIPNGQFLIAANGGSNNITVFSVAGNGALTPVVGSPFAAGGFGPDGIKVAPNGQFLSVALADSDQIGMFRIAANGALTPAPGSPFASPATGQVAGVDVNCASTFLYGAQANSGGTNVDVFSIGPNGALTLVQTSNNPGVGNNSNVGVLSPNDQFLFVSNQDTNSVTAFNVAANGTLSLVAGSPFFGTGGGPSGVATNAAGTFVFTANFENSTVTSFSIAGNGVLTLVGSFGTGQSGFSGLTSLTVFPGKSCSTLIFDVCLQDEANGNFLSFNSQTGDYIFTVCSQGVQVSGKGTIQTSADGCTISLTHIGPNQKTVKASINTCNNTGQATLTVVTNRRATIFSIKDLDTTNNTCACP